MKIKIKRLHPNLNIDNIKKIEQGDWIDLYACTLKDMQTKEVYDLNTSYIDYKPGDYFLVGLGVAMELPEGYEAHIAPRGSTFKNFGLIQTNSVGVVDESYKGDNDEWFIPVFACTEGVLEFGDKICQFRIMKKMPPIEFEKVKKLNNNDRGGFGSTGIK